MKRMAAVNVAHQVFFVIFNLFILLFLEVVIVRVQCKDKISIAFVCYETLFKTSENGECMQNMRF